MVYVQFVEKTLLQNPGTVEFKKKKKFFRVMVFSVFISGIFMKLIFRKLRKPNQIKAFFNKIYFYFLYSFQFFFLFFCFLKKNKRNTGAKQNIYKKIDFD